MIHKRIIRTSIIFFGYSTHQGDHTSTVFLHPVKAGQKGHGQGEKVLYTDSVGNPNKTQLRRIR